MKVSTARRAVGDALAVCRHAEPGSAVLWATSVMTAWRQCARHGSLRPADRIWSRKGARFRTSSGTVVSLPPAYTPGAREMYCRNVYLRSGLIMPNKGWVVDLGANCGLFSVWAALTGAQVVAVEAQQGFAEEIRHLAAHNGVEDRVHVEVAMASGATMSGSDVGVLANDRLWASASHGAPTRPVELSMPKLMATYQIDRIGLLKADIEGGEFAIFSDWDMTWLDKVDQITLEVHPQFGNVGSLIERLRNHGFRVELRDNDGKRVAKLPGHLEYLYGHRP
jgi:FkbM family methyltransferase